MLVAQKKYKEQMNQVVLPYLKMRKEECYAEKEADRLIHFILYEAEQPKGIVIISHGFSESAAKYKEVIYYFVKEGYHVCALEHCGHGRSYRLTNGDMSLVHVDSYQRYVDDLLFISHAIVEKYNKLPLYLYAHSMGGGIAAAAAAKDPQLYKKVILTSPMIRPNTGKVPWVAAKLLADMKVAKGKGMDYVPGHNPYSPGEKFEDSAATAKERFDYYQEKRESEVVYQTNAGSYSWFKAAAELNHDLQTEGVKKIQSDILLFQAENDTWVSCEEQNRFIKKIQKEGKAKAQLTVVKNVKHEIYNAADDVLEKYWKQIFDFLNS